MHKLANEHHSILHVSPATMFSTPSLYPLYHVKMDNNKTKTLCIIHHKLSSYYCQTLQCVTCHQSISINTQTATSHFTLQLKSPCIAILCQLQIIAKRYLIPLTINNHISHTNFTQILKSKFNFNKFPFPINQLLAIF